MPVLLAPSRLTASMIRAGVSALVRRLDDWTLRAFDTGIPPRTH